MAQSGSDSYRLTLTDGSDSFRSFLEGGRDSVRSSLEGGSDSFRSTLDGGHGFMLKNWCDLCEQEGLQKKAVGFCVDCHDYLCSECFRNHLKPKPLRHHVLLDQHQMPSREDGKTRAQYVMDIKVRSKDDRKTPCISGCAVLSGDKLVVVDNRNDKIKMIDLKHNKIVSELKLGGWLWDITQVDSTQVALPSYTTQTIFVVNVKAKKLKLDRELKVKGRYQGIASINDNLIVSYDDPVKVEIISMTGKVLQTVVTEDKWRELLTMPRYVAVTKDQQTIYISDCIRHTVTSVNLTGKLQATYKDDKLRAPLGLTVDSAGRVYVCGEDSNNILQLTADLTEVQVFLKNSDGVNSPKSIYICEATDRLYIGMSFSNVVKVYQLK